MKAAQGDGLLRVASPFDAPTRDGEVLEVGGDNGESPYLVRWADGYLCPEPSSTQRVGAEHGHLAKVVLLSDARTRRAQRR